MFQIAPYIFKNEQRVWLFHILGPIGEWVPWPWSMMPFFIHFPPFGVIISSIGDVLISYRNVDIIMCIYLIEQKCFYMLTKCFLYVFMQLRSQYRSWSVGFNKYGFLNLFFILRKVDLWGFCFSRTRDTTAWIQRIWIYKNIMK